MQLTIKERLIALQLMPVESDFTTLRVVRKAREALSFTDAEHAKFGIKVADGRAMWDSDKDVGVEIELGAVATSLLVAALKKLNTDHKLTDDHYSLYEKFIPDEANA